MTSRRTRAARTMRGMPGHNADAYELRKTRHWALDQVACLWCALGPPRAPVAQLDRALPSEGRGRTFESCRVRHPASRHYVLSPAPGARDDSTAAILVVTEGLRCE